MGSLLQEEDLLMEKEIKTLRTLVTQPDSAVSTRIKRLYVPFSSPVFLFLTST